MEKKIRYTLGKEERLKSRKLIEQLFKEGKSIAVFPLRVIYIVEKGEEAVFSDHQLTSIHPTIQAGFTASSRNFKKAVHRNRIKRLMREAWRLQKHSLQLPMSSKASLFIFFIYVGKELPLYELVYEKMAIIIKRFTRIMDENR
ncbi:MAG: ribonuclease P protein component [Ferruginibacter sp.]